MGMAIARYRRQGEDAVHWGEWQGGQVYPLATAARTHQALMAEYFQDPQGLRARRAADAPLAPADITLLSPIDSNVQLFCQGLNYAEHREESGASAAAEEESLLFMKAASSICGPNDTILRPRGCELLDYEIELALVLKRDIAAPVHIAEADLPEYVGGLVLCNDVSARDLMFGAPMLQWFRGKSQRTFCPMGPILYLLDAEDFHQLYHFKLELKVNGAVRQSATTADLIHRPAPTLTSIASFADMQTGDCLLTGTPGGVLAGSNLKVALAILANFRNDRKRREKFTQAQLARERFLQPGDVLELSIVSEDGAIDLGRQRNVIADA